MKNIENSKLSLAYSTPRLNYDRIVAPIASELALLDTRIQDLIERFVDPFFPEATLLCKGGKRIRSVLCLLFAKAFTNDPITLAKTVSVSTYIEGIHLCSLLHDDVIDNANERRGNMTLHQRYGRTGAILAGDMIYIKLFHHFLHSDVSSVMDIVIEGAIGMVEGETEQTLIAIKELEPTVPEYLHSISRKTALFFQSAAESGAVLGTENNSAILSDKLRNAVRVFGHEFGMAFQIVDDILDWNAEQKDLGKDLLADIRSSKLTLPLLIFMEDDYKKARKLIETAKNGDMNELAGIISDGGYLDKAYQVAERYAERARTALKDLKTNTDNLNELVEYTLTRKN